MTESVFLCIISPAYFIRANVLAPFIAGNEVDKLVLKKTKSNQQNEHQRNEKKQLLTVAEAEWEEVGDS